MVIYHLGGKVRDNKLSVCFPIFCFTHGGVFVNITKFKVPVLPLCHLIVPENGWRIVCSGLKKAAANAGSLGTENQYYPPSYNTKPALVAYGKVKGIFFVICSPSCLQFAYYTHTHLCVCVCARDCHRATCTIFSENLPLCHCVKYL